MPDAEMIKNGVDSHDYPLAELVPMRAALATPMRTTWVDRLAMEKLVEASPEELRKLHGLLEETMNGLVMEPEPARMRVLARTIALLRAKVMLLEGIADSMLAARDFLAMTAVQKALDGTARRLAMMLSEHRLATHGERRSIAVAVAGQAVNVNVQALR
jgi:hypothetical protein